MPYLLPCKEVQSWDALAYRVSTERASACNLIPNTYLIYCCVKRDLICLTVPRIFTEGASYVIPKASLIYCWWDAFIVPSFYSLMRVSVKPKYLKKTQISLAIDTVWSDSKLFTWWSSDCSIICLSTTLIRPRRGCTASSLDSGRSFAVPLLNGTRKASSRSFM